ncbi:MAG: hypothetical protein COB67_00605 [SAR324 cluster bacterium]|uniref:Uncharacterized protein n=1 Tax=SAR324 cluster bacterium TaxID=2024889 RepID=A0A2A4TDF4_9DELT|nr:MAG: hypothetical protein COB67_00605 [SAR324 cluster bacterium]
MSSLLGWEVLLYLSQYKAVLYIYAFIVAILTLLFTSKSYTEYLNKWERTQVGVVSFVASTISIPFAIFMAFSVFQLIGLFGNFLLSGDKW